MSLKNCETAMNAIINEKGDELVPGLRWRSGVRDGVQYDVIVLSTTTDSMEISGPIWRALQKHLAANLLHNIINEHTFDGI